MKRPDAATVQLGGPAASDEVFASYYPTLHEYLTCTVWDDGKHRKPSTVLLMTENGRWKACIHDRDGKCSAWVTAGAHEELLQLLDKQLSEGSVEWRRDTR